MRITSLGHAGLRLETAQLGLVLDPWFSPRGAFLGSWHPFPSNAHLDADRLLDCDWVAVSHEHLDHMDLELLRRLPERTGVVIPAYPSASLNRRLRGAGVRRIVEVAAWQRLSLNRRGDWLTVIPEQSPMCHDAAILVVADGLSVLHCNDARLSVAQAKRAAHVAGGVDVLLIQASGASWYPICYDYPPDRMAEISARKRHQKFQDAARVVRAVRPRLAVPFAGPPCFLDDELRHHNRWVAPPGIFPDQAQAADWLARHLSGQVVTHWMPGDVYEPGPRRHRLETRWEGFSYAEPAAVEAHIETLAGLRRGAIAAERADHPPPGDDLGERFEEHFARLGELSPYFLERIDMTVRFDVTGAGGGCWDVCIGPGRIRVNHRGGGSRAAQYQFRVESRWLAAVLAGDSGWEDLLLSLRFSAWRDPDLYNDHLVGLLKHADADALRAIQRYERSRRSDERLILHTNGATYEVPRFCPHAGQDLSEGAIVSGSTLRCLGHDFEFDLETGECLNARCAPLQVRRLGDGCGVGDLTPITVRSGPPAAG